MSLNGEGQIEFTAHRRVEVASPNLSLSSLTGILMLRRRGSAWIGRTGFVGSLEGSSTPHECNILEHSLTECRFIAGGFCQLDCRDRFADLQRKP
jgi:hypothetical protein